MDATLFMVVSAGSAIEQMHFWEIPSLTSLDLQPGNIVFAVSAADIDEALSKPGTTPCDVRWKNGVKSDQSAPKHLYVPEPIIDCSLISGQPGHKVMVAITDLGGGAWSPRLHSRNRLTFTKSCMAWQGNFTTP